MSIFTYKYGDEILLYYNNTDIDLCNILKCINKYYYNLINTNDNHKNLTSLLDYSKKNYENTIKFKNRLFLNACEKGNMIICNYLINKFNDIDIHVENEYAFQLSCEHGYLEISKWLVDLSLQKNFIPINIHANNEAAFQKSCMNNHLEVAKWLVNLSL